MTRFTTQFKILCLLVIIFGGGIIIHIKRESNYINNFHEQILPIIATKSYFIGCVSGSKGDIEFCRTMRDSYKHEIQRIMELDEDKE